jgi:probable O-glycosylation ligase (exosortase A-associated)
MSKGLIFTYLMTYGGALVALFNPFIGLLIYVCFAIIKPDAMWGFALGQTGNYSRIVAIALLIGWAMRGFGRWQFYRGTGIVAALLGYWLWSNLGAALAEDQDAAWIFVESLTKIVLPFLVGITIIDSMAKLKALIWVIVVSQGYVAYELNLSYYDGTNIVHEQGFGGMDNNCVAIAMVACVGMAFFLGLQAERWWQKALALTAAMLMVHVVMFSFSRGGLLALILTSFLAFALVPKQPKHYLVFLLVVLLGFRLAGPLVVERFMTTFTDPEKRDESSQSRIILWEACWDTMQKEPVLGVGPNNWGLRVQAYGFPRGKEAHTLWLQVGAEQGFPGLGLLVLFYGLCVLRLWPVTRARYPVPDPWLRAVARMVISSLIGFAIAAQFVTLEGLEVPYYITLVGAVSLKLLVTPAPGPAAAPFRTPAPSGRLVAQGV